MIGTNNVNIVNSCMKNYGELKSIRNMKKPEQARTERAEAGRAESSDKSKISRKEADKVVVPPWPKSHDLGSWKKPTIVERIECMCRY